eukprot:CAMPEP_0197037310 /NCGR_PEP_ID=MMETSP1384-20130603/14553_1 /TAXON_ID=29189 /ORGANISM="Ammonia sp." /LENGTH=1015 /DNA_ID=CAMNT_0042467593 /DNA_START=87 /DNA_END=3134 /DNA_ORIENTATION=-
MHGVKVKKQSNYATEAPGDGSTLPAKRSLFGISDSNSMPTKKKRKCNVSTSLSPDMKEAEYDLNDIHLALTHHDSMDVNVKPSEHAKHKHAMEVDSEQKDAGPEAKLPSNPTVTILSSCDNLTTLNRHHERKPSVNTSAPPHIRSDNHYSNQHAHAIHHAHTDTVSQHSTEHTANIHMDINTNLERETATRADERPEDTLSVESSSAATAMQKKPVFSMTIQKRRNMSKEPAEMASIPGFEFMNVSEHGIKSEEHNLENDKNLSNYSSSKNYSTDTNDTSNEREESQQITLQEVTADFVKEAEDENVHKIANIPQLDALCPIRSDAASDKDDELQRIPQHHKLSKKKPKLEPEFVGAEHDDENETHEDNDGEEDKEHCGMKEDDDTKLKSLHRHHHGVLRVMRLLLDAKRVGGLIGKGGVAITKIRNDSQAKILIAKPIPHSLFRICTIEGEYGEIVAAICLITDKMAEESTRLPPYQITVLVEEKNIGCLIGKKGNAITEIRNTTSANIYISSNLLRGSSEKTVDICGEREAVHAAVQMVIRRLCENPTYATTRMLYDPQMDFPSTPTQSATSQALAVHPSHHPHSPHHVQTQQQQQQQQQHALQGNNANSAAQAGLFSTHGSPAMSGLYTTWCPQQLSAAAANNNRLLNYALQKFASLPSSVQPQIISAANSSNTTSTAAAANRLLSPLNRHLAATASATSLLTPSILTNSLSPFGRPNAISAYNQNTIPLNTTSPLSTKSNSSNNPNPQIISPHCSSLSPQRNETNTFVNNSIFNPPKGNHAGNAPLNNDSHRNHPHHHGNLNASTSNLNRSHSNNDSHNLRNRNNHKHSFSNLNVNSPHNHHVNNNNTNNNQRNRRNVVVATSAPSTPTPSAQLIPTTYSPLSAANLYYNPRLIGTATISPLSSTRNPGAHSASPGGLAANTKNTTPPLGTTSATVSSTTIPVAAHLIGGVIGRGGRNIQEIRRQTNAEIKIDNERQNQTAERYITINGTPQQISTAICMIQNSLTAHTYP